MSLRMLLISAVAFGALGFTAARAADMPEGVVYADNPELDCSDTFSRQVDKVYLPPQTAYIVAGCGRDRDWVRNLFGKPGARILVYYNGGSMYKTDITRVRVGH